MNTSTEPGTVPEAEPQQPRPKVDKQKVFNSFTPQQIEGMRGLVFNPRNFEEVWFLADFFSRAGAMVPEIYRGNIEACAMAIMWGLELQISPLQAITGITVVGGAPKVWGDLQHALVVTHPDFESFREWTEVTAEEGLIAFCEVKRKGHEPVVRQFSARDAIIAGLAGKDTHKKYPKRMLPMRARSWAERDALPHALRGLGNADEMIDVTDVGRDRPVSRVRDSIPMPTAIEHEPNPLNDLARTGVDFADLETEFAQGDPAVSDEERARRVHAASPDLSALSGDGDKSQELDLSPPRAVPLTFGQRTLVDLSLDATHGRITEQDVIDELGAAIDGTNVGRALEWIAAEDARRAAQD